MYAKRKQDLSHKLVKEMKEAAAAKGDKPVVAVKKKVKGERSTGHRKVVARLSQKAMRRVRSMAKAGQQFLEDVPVSRKSFPDPQTHKAVIKIVDVLLDAADVLLTLAEGTDIFDEQTIDVIEDMKEIVEDAVGGEKQDEPIEEMELDDLLDEADDVVIEEPEEEALSLEGTY